MSDMPPKKKLKQETITSMFAKIDSQKKTEGHCATDNSEIEKMDCDDQEMSSETVAKYEQDIICNDESLSPLSPSLLDETELAKTYVSPKKQSEQNHEKNIKVDADAIGAESKLSSHFKMLEHDFKRKLQAPSVAERRNLLAEAAENRIARKRKSSTDMFNSSDTTPSCSEEMVSWRGCPLSSLMALSHDNMNVGPVTPWPTHAVLVKLPLSEREPTRPHPSSFQDLWDSDHVRMPCSSQSLYPAQDNCGGVVQRWTVIVDAYREPINSIDEFLDAVLSYNQRFQTRWNFRGLKRLVETDFAEMEYHIFFNDLLPGIIKLALSLPTVITQPIPLLTAGTSRSVTISQKQVACLLANAFLCTFPRRNAKGPNTEFGSYPDINFNRLFSHNQPQALEKLKCILHYFKEILNKEPDGVLTFSRQSIPLSGNPSHECCSELLPNFHIDTNGLIEEANGLLQVDFANKFLGGGVLGLGCVQEEIRFVLCPELLITRLIGEVLSRDEAVIVTGVERFNKSSGYSSTFRWEGPFYDVTPRDTHKRRLCQVVCLDAVNYNGKKQIQYRSDQIMRELHKAFVGFTALEGSSGKNTAVATGNWGCGAFMGNALLKGLIQIAACGLAGRDLAYFTFGDQQIRNELADMFQLLKDNDVNVGQLVMVLCQYGTGASDDISLSDYIKKNLLAFNADTDSENDVMEDSETSNQKVSKELARSITDYFQSVPKSESASTTKQPLAEEYIEEALSNDNLDSEGEEPMSTTSVARDVTDKSKTKSVFDLLEMS